MIANGKRLHGLTADLVAAIDGVVRRWLPESEVDSVVPAARSPGTTATPFDISSRAKLARTIYRARRDRDNEFRAAGLMFGEPDWDILLDLYCAHLERSAVSVSSACIASAVPPTTGLRHLTTLEHCGLVERDYDPFDRRRCYVSLSATGVAHMNAWFARFTGDPAASGAI